MTGTLIALISIVIGIVAANVTGYVYKKYSFGVIGNTLIGVFGSVFLIKSFGRLGFDPWSIMNDGDFDGMRLIINLLVSALGGVLGLIVTKMIYSKMNKE
ncbi:hypothetical protein HSX10_13055 [Winogradskyella undariae]|uniref:hypothetical protein n=1 Tax=Winogradskyella undariae TaxID=1285465 RepID=UPI00156B7745|nr:hypothetical protein [Winogradskyella undariae]NRR92496.1 hypothetical protein [Winogradskyella undariae]